VVRRGGGGGAGLPLVTAAHVVPGTCTHTAYVADTFGVTMSVISRIWRAAEPGEERGPGELVRREGDRAR
jgi:hypothetical protein